MENQGLWVLRQLALEQRNRNTYLFLRSIDRSSHVVFSVSIHGLELADTWRDWLYAALCKFSARGNIIQYGVNPRPTGAKTVLKAKTIPTCVPVSFHVDPKHPLGERLKQLAFLKSAGFEPSWTIQRFNQLYGIYLLSEPTTEDKVTSAVRRIHRLIDCRYWADCCKPYLMLPLPGFRCDGTSNEVVKLLSPDTVCDAKVYPVDQLASFPDVRRERYEHFFALPQPEGLSYLSALLEEASKLGDERPLLAGIESARSKREERRLAATVAFVEPSKCPIPPVEALDLKYQTLVKTFIRRGPACRDAFRKLVRAYTGKTIRVDIDEEVGFQSVIASVVRQLIERRYTRDAVTEFFGRPEHAVGSLIERAELEAEYAKQYAILRAAHEPKLATPYESVLLEFVACVCRVLPDLKTNEARELAMVRNEVLHVKSRSAYRLYRTAMIAAGRLPKEKKEISRFLENCREPYWLGTRMIDGHKIWSFSLKHLQALGLLIDTDFLTAV